MCMSLSIVGMLQTGFRQGELVDGERILLIYLIWFALLGKLQCLSICGCSYVGSIAENKKYDFFIENDRGSMSLGGRRSRPNSQL
jgi:hypothetical protein